MESVTGRDHRACHRGGVLFGLLALALAWAGLGIGVADLRAQAPPRAQPVRPARPVVGGAEGDLWDYSVLLYSRREYELAARQFEKFLDAYPRSAHVPMAFFRLGECHLRLEDETRAERAYVNLLSRFKKGDAAGSAAYRLGSMRYNMAKFEDAAQFYALAEVESQKPEVRLSASYYRARALERLGRPDEALESYARVAAIEKNNPYRANALRLVASDQMKRGLKDEALANFVKVTQDPEAAGKPGMLAEALVKAGMIVAEKGKPEDAIPWFDKALSLEDPKGEAAEWKAVATYSAVRSHYEAGAWDKVILAYRGGRASRLSEGTEPRILLMAGNAYRKQSRFREAAEVYITLGEKYPSTEEALEGGYRKLLCFLEMKSDRLPEFVDQYVEQFRRSHAGHEFLDRAMLLKAEGFFTKGEYEEAAKAYGKLKTDNVPEALLASVVYKKGWAEAEGGFPERAVASFSEYLEKHAESGNADKALAKRALARRAVKDFPNAIKDLKRVVDEFPASPTVEMALQQSALIKGEMRDLPGMIEDFGTLLEKFPQSIGAAEANYWIGWANFELKEFAKALGPLRAAARMDAENYADKAALRIVLSNYYLEDVDGLAAELDRYIEKHSASNIPGDVFFWAGVEKFKAGDPALADRFLTLGSSPRPRQGARRGLGGDGPGAGPAREVRPRRGGDRPVPPRRDQTGSVRGQGAARPGARPARERRFRRGAGELREGVREGQGGPGQRRAHHLPGGHFARRREGAGGGRGGGKGRRPVPRGRREVRQGEPGFRRPRDHPGGDVEVGALPGASRREREGGRGAAPTQGELPGLPAGGLAGCVSPNRLRRAAGCSPSLGDARGETPGGVASAASAPASRDGWGLPR